MRQTSLSAVIQNHRLTAPNHRWLSGAVIVGQVAGAYVLLLSTGVLIQCSFVALAKSPGYNQSQLQIVSFYTPGTGDRTNHFLAALNTRLASLGEVKGVSLATGVPPTMNRRGVSIEREQGFSSRFVTAEAYVDENYFSVMGIRLLTGRGFGTSLGDCVVSRSFARTVWQSDDVVGRTYKESGNNHLRTVVGLVDDAPNGPVDAETLPAVFYPRESRPTPFLMQAVVRVSTPITLSSLTSMFYDLDPGSAVDKVVSSEQLRRNVNQRLRISAVVMSGFAALALLLVGTGLYSVAVLDLARQEQELAIRAAIGGSPTALLLMLLSRLSAFAFLGVLIAAPFARFVARGLEPLVGIDTRTALIQMSTITTVLAVAVAAVGIPTVGAIRRVFSQTRHLIG